MSDYERDIDIESEEDDEDLEEEEDFQDAYSSKSNLRHSQLVSEADKREHHNQLERKRRDQIKDNFAKLREAVKLLRNEKVASRAQILKKAAEYIRTMQDQNRKNLSEIADLKRQNNLLESQINMLGDPKSRNGSPIQKYEVKEELSEEEVSFEEDINESTSSDSESDESDSDDVIHPPKRHKVEYIEDDIEELEDY